MIYLFWIESVVCSELSSNNHLDTSNLLLDCWNNGETVSFRPPVNVLLNFPLRSAAPVSTNYPIPGLIFMSEWLKGVWIWEPVTTLFL